MVQVPIVSGIYADEHANVRASYPVNMQPVGLASGVSNGHLRPAEGIVSLGLCNGLVRGGINWNGTLYRVAGGDLISIDANDNITTIGTVGGVDDPVTMVYSFDRLAIATQGALWLYDGTTLTEVTDIDLGIVLDVVFIDGYFMTTDGEFLVVTELNDPTAVDPLKYGSSEVDPDPVVALKVIRNEVYAVNRYTIEVFDNVGGNGFPFQRIDGAQFQRGAVGTHACCVFDDQIAFVGGGRNEGVGVYIGSNAQTQKISDSEIDRLLASYTDAQLADVVMESRILRDQRLLYIHLPDRTLCFDATATGVIGAPAWFVLTSAAVDFAAYRARYFVLAYNRWTAGDTLTFTHGEMSEAVGSHFGAVVRWEFATPLVYNESRGGVVFDVELVAVAGSVAVGSAPTISTSYSIDQGATWSPDMFCLAGGSGNRVQRLVWFRQGFFRQTRTQRFQGDSSAHVTFHRLEARIAPLVV